MRDFCALRRAVRRPILFYMENFSTPKKAALPWVTNVTTLAVVLCTTWWSSAQRPVSPPADSMRVTAPGQRLPMLRQAVAPLNTALTTLPTNTAGSGSATTLSSEGFVSVGFTGAGLR